MARTPLHKTFGRNIAIQQSQTQAIIGLAAPASDIATAAASIANSQDKIAAALSGKVNVTVLEIEHWPWLLLYPVLTQDGCHIAKTGLMSSIFRAAGLTHVCEIAACRTGKALREALRKHNQNNGVNKYLVESLPLEAFNQCVAAAIDLCRLARDDKPYKSADAS